MGVRPTVVADMAARDRLAPALRCALDASPFCLSPALFAADIRRCRLDEAGALAFLANLERAARDDMPRAVPVSGRNELSRK
jgi:hypothetical protein